MGILNKKDYMGNKRKLTGKIDVHLYFDERLSDVLRKDSTKQCRTFAEQIRYIITKHYMEEKSS